jgi:hypothetical protein
VTVHLAHADNFKQKKGFDSAVIVELDLRRFMKK